MRGGGGASTEGGGVVDGGALSVGAAPDDRDFLAHSLLSFS